MFGSDIMSNALPLWPGGPRFIPSPSFPLGMDTVLLADFTRPGGAGRCADLGCGAGALSVLLMARFGALRLTGVELDPDAVELARRNTADNGWVQQVDIITGDLRDIRALLPGGGFDAVVSNPPYFSPSSGKTAQGAKGVARQQTECTLADVCAAAAYLLKNGGRFTLCYRPEALTDALLTLRAAALEPKRLRLVHHDAGKRPSLALLEARRSGAPGLEALPPLLLTDERGEYTAEYRRIYHMDTEG